MTHSFEMTEQSPYPSVHRTFLDSAWVVRQFEMTEPMCHGPNRGQGVSWRLTSLAMRPPSARPATTG